ncbi:DNA-binding transcriptional activator of the SARP family [Amycolatopsis marina]|uniref:DNA-binding transcriptional activator of the SARP family n=1 Tax=Amycolatopsis marina TaxID=490629 RepID=A0A1I1CQ94_9PSEU|nr:AfsR/SARP family transcriptional regulator [Amycolatopsis marina]SFB64821.1 DNA-binding transcriptional activator of the SARP family [Amycolatopsis marina]
MPVRVSVFGALRLVRDGEQVTPSQPKLRQLIALLAVNEGEVVRLESITAELWDETPSDKRIRIIQTYISQLRRILFSPGANRPIGTTGALEHLAKVGYRLVLSSDDHLDLREFHHFRTAGDDNIAALRAATDLSRGCALADVALGPELREHRARLDANRTAVFEEYLRQQLRAGRPGAVLEQAERIRAEDPRHEELYASLVLALGASGRRADAVELFHTLRGRRVRDTGIEPGAALRSAFEQVLADTANEHREQTVISEPPARPAAPAQVPQNDPGFLGFAAELEAASAALTGLRRSRPAVLAVVGAPGAGTTTFCTRLANGVSAHFPDGQLFADLAVVAPQDALAGFINAVRPGAHVPADRHERVRLFRECTTGKRILVVLDHVRCGLDVPMLQPGSAGGAMLLGCSARIGIDTVTSAMDLPRMSESELLLLLTRRIGRARVERERAIAHDLVTWCSGHPLGVALIASLVRTRPHWSLGRLLRRLAHEPSPQTLAAGGFDIVASVRQRTDLLDSAEMAWLGAFARAEPGPDPVPVTWAADVLRTPVHTAERMLERLVEVRLADPHAPARGGPGGRYRYRLDPLYQLAVLDIAGRQENRLATAQQTAS